MLSRHEEKLHVGTGAEVCYVQRRAPEDLAMLTPRGLPPSYAIHPVTLDAGIKMTGL